MQASDLLTERADPRHQKSTPLDYAVNGNHTACVDILMAHGGVNYKTMELYAVQLIQRVFRGWRVRKRLKNADAEVSGRSLRTKTCKMSRPKWGRPNTSCSAPFQFKGFKGRKADRQQ